MKVMRVTMIAALVTAFTVLAMSPIVSASAQSPPKLITWLAAGDSYSSGEGLPHSIGPCAQADEGNSKTWADVASGLLRRRHKSLAYAYPPVLVACTGATTNDFIDAEDHGGTPEWNPSMGRFDLVTFTFGGDNIGFAPIIEQCVGLSRLVADVENASTAGLGIANYVAPLPSDPGHSCPAASIIRRRIATFGSQSQYPSFLNKVADQVVQPGGNIVVLGYPDLVELPKFWATWEQHVGSCWGIGTGDATELRGLAGDLNATIGAAIKAFDAEPSTERDGVRATFVDVNTANGSTPSNDPNLFEPSSGTRHNLCSADPWLNGGSAIDYGNGSFHPKQEGLDNEGALAAGVIAKLSWSHLVQLGAWTAPSSSLIPAGLELSGISCVSASFCMAVGDTYGQTAGNNTTPTYAAYVWNGSTWSETPNPGSSLASGLSPGGGWLDSVSCVSITMCVATYDGWRPLINSYGIGELVYGASEWNGSTWRGMGFPDPGDQLTGLDCVTAQWCMAVIDPGQDIGNSGKVMSAIWNGQSWAIDSIGNLTVPGDTPFSLSCPTTTFCMTTSNLYGLLTDSSLSSTQQNVSYRWNGSTWSEVSWPTQAVAVNSLSCPTTTFCIQLATPNTGTPGAGDGDVQFTWNGSDWSEDATPLPGPISTYSLDCASTSLCMAVGGDTDGPPITPYGPRPPTVDVWDGWKWLTIQWPSTAPDAVLDAVSCAPAGSCGVIAGSVVLNWHF